MKRLLEQELSIWLTRKGRKPLIIRGARQVGKSTLVRQFAKNHSLELVEVNLERNSYLNAVFKTKDLSKILPELEVVAGKSLAAPNILLFLDEIQSTPEAIAALRYFYEEKPDLPVIATGSLLEFVLSDHQFSMPVGRIEYLHAGPMTFREFLMAIGEDYLLGLINQGEFLDLPESAHRNLLHLQRQYLFVGGMPESVLRFSETRSPVEVGKVHRSIIQTYEDDFSRYARTDQNRELLEQFLRLVPNAMGRKVIYSRLFPHHRSGTVKKAIDLLVKARLLIPAYHSDGSGIPLAANENRSVYKLYFLDVGLMNSICKLEWSQISNFDERQLIHEGIIAEQFIAQHLAYHQYHQPMGAEAPELHYWLRENRSQNAEVDFVVQQGRRILPVEVKSGKSGRLKSLQQFLMNKSLNVALRFDLNQPSRQDLSYETLHYTFHSWPLYLVERMDDLSA